MYYGPLGVSHIEGMNFDPSIPTTTPVFSHVLDIDGSKLNISVRIRFLGQRNSVIFNTTLNYCSTKIYFHMSFIDRDKHVGNVYLY